MNICSSNIEQNHFYQNNKHKSLKCPVQDLRYVFSSNLLIRWIQSCYQIIYKSYQITALYFAMNGLGESKYKVTHVLIRPIFSQVFIQESFLFYKILNDIQFKKSIYLKLKMPIRVKFLYFFQNHFTYPLSLNIQNVRLLAAIINSLIFCLRPNIQLRYCLYTTYGLKSINDLQTRKKCDSIYKIQNFTMLRQEHSLNKQPSKENEENIVGFIQALRSITNPFLLQDVKSLVSGMSIQNLDHVEIPSFLPQNIHLKFSFLLNKLKSLEDVQKNRLLQYLCLSITQVKSLEDRLWPAPNLLLQLSCVKRLNPTITAKLIDILCNIKESNKLEIFFKDIYDNKQIDQSQLEAEISKLQLEGDTGYDLTSLITHILDSKPAEKSVFQRIKENLNNPDVFVNQIIRISSKNDDELVYGKINSAESTAESLTFRIFGQEMHQQTFLSLKGGYISQVKTIQQTTQLLGNAIKTNYENCLQTQGKSFGFSLQMFSLRRQKPNVVLQHDIQINPNPNKLSEASYILPSGRYKVTKAKNVGKKKVHYLWLQSIGFQSNSSYLENNESNQIKKEKVKFQIQMWGEGCNMSNYFVKSKKNGQDNFISYNEFFNSYIVKRSTQHTFKYDSPVVSQKKISLAKASNEDKGLDLIQRLKQLNRKKNQLVGKMRSDYREIYEFLLMNILENQGDLPWLEVQLKEQISKLPSSDLFNSSIGLIIEGSRQVGFNSSFEQCVLNIIIETNYISLVNKADSINAVRIMSLLSEAQKKAYSMKGKSIVFFCGSTGSGKSTTVNYFMGVPLEKYTNFLGDQVVRINEKKFQRNINVTKIGQSVGTSETIYSQGHEFIKENFKSQTLLQLMQGVNLCDNPGFNDTRGSEYQICTNLSVDRAVSLCKQIKSIVLIVPYQALTLDRANHFIQLLNLMTQRFPNILDQNSPESQNFYIIITKWTSDLQKNSFKKRIETHIDEQKSLLKKMQTADSLNEYELSCREKRLKTFKFIKHMDDNQKIDFIKVTCALSRNKILAKHLNRQRKGVNQSSYVKAMEGRDMQKSFSDQIAVCTHTWTKMILSPYFEEIPEQICVIQKQIQKLEIQLKQDKDERLNIQKNIKDNIDLKDDLQNERIEFAKRQLQRVQKGESYFTDEQKDGLCTDRIQDYQIQSILKQKQKQLRQQYYLILNSYAKKKLDLSYNIARAKSKIIQMNKQNQKSKESLIDLQKRKEKIDSNLAVWKDGGYTPDEIYKLHNHIGKKVKVGKGQSTLEQRLEMVQKGKQMPKTGTAYQFIIGQKDIDLYTVRNIQKKYVLLPNKQFDPNNYLNNIKTSYLDGKYKTQIKSKNVVLQGTNLSGDGKKITLSYKLQYRKGTIQSECVPQLQITHHIPNAQIFWSQIHNADADLCIVMRLIHQQQNRMQTNGKGIHNLQSENIKFTKQMESKQADIFQINTRIQDRLIAQQKNLKQTNRQLKIQNIKVVKRANLQNKQKQLQRVLESIFYQTKDLSQIKKQIDQKTKKVGQTRAKLAKMQTLHKQFALLIKHQLKSSVPQSIQKFIKIAYSMSHKEVQKAGNFAKAAQMKSLNYNKFIEIYDKHKQKLEMTVTRHLSQTKE